MNLDSIQRQLKTAGVTDLTGTQKEVKALPDIIDDAETIQYATSGLSEKVTTILFVCTDKRLLLVDKGLLYGTKLTEIPLNNVTGVSYATGLLFGKITIVAGLQTTTIDEVDKATAPAMVTAIKKWAQHFNTTVTQTGSTHSANSELIAQLRDLKQLVDEGVLTEAEFAAKKKQVLGL